MTSILRGIADHLAQQWELTDLKLGVQTPYGEIFFARQHGQDVVLKVPNPKMEEPGAVLALQHFAEFGGVRLSLQSEQGHLMTRCRPGTPLSRLVEQGKDDEAMVIVCDIASKLHRAGPDQRFEGLPLWRPRYDGVSVDGLAPETYTTAKALYTQLEASQSTKTVLHGDLHHDNILEDATQGWLAIDPKGYLGEPAYEYGCALRNPGEDPARFADARIINRRLDIIARETDLDRTRILQWAFAQAVLSAIWSAEDGNDLMCGISSAQVLETLL